MRVAVKKTARLKRCRVQTLCERHLLAAAALINTQATTTAARASLMMKWMYLAGSSNFR